MELQTLHRTLNEKNIALSLNDLGKLKYEAPKEAVTADIIKAIKEHRNTLLATLQSEAPQAHQQEIERLNVTQNRHEITELIRQGVTYTAPGYRPPGLAPLGMRCHVCGLGDAFVLWNGNRPYCLPCQEKERQEIERARQEEKYQAPAHQEEHQLPLAPAHQEEHQLPLAPETQEPAHKPNKSKASRQKVTVYADVRKGSGVTDAGEKFEFAPGLALSELLKMRMCERLYVCGPVPDAYEAWLLDAAMWDTYTTGKRGHYFDKERQEAHVARYQHRVTGDEVEIRTMDSWFGDEAYTPEQAREAMLLLNEKLQKFFKGSPIAYGTPSLTFQSLWSLQNRIEGRKFDVLPDDIRNRIHGSSGQGRIEMLTPPDVKKMPGIWYYDGIFMYAALTWGLPTEVETHDYENAYAGKQLARYRIRYTVPSTWQHIGPFMTPKEQVTGRDIDNQSWAWPGENSQGKTYETWADGSELDALITQAYRPYYQIVIPANASKEEIARLKTEAYARATEAAFTDWNITILERIVYTNEKDSTSKRPLDSISKKLVLMRETVEQEAAKQEGDTALVYRLVRGAIRNILLHGIGAFHRQNRDTTVILKAGEPAPDGFTNSPMEVNGLIWYSVPQKLEAYTEQFNHPEYSQTVWARCRARMTKDALSLPREALVTIRTDAIAVSVPQPQWTHNTEIGKLRQKWAITRAVKAPHTFEELDALVMKHVK